MSVAVANLVMEDVEDRALEMFDIHAAPLLETICG